MRIVELNKRQQADRRFIPATSPCLWTTVQDYDDSNGEILVIELELGFRVVERMEVEEP